MSHPVFPICPVSRVTVSVCPLSAVTLSVPCLTYLNFRTITFQNLKTFSSLRLGRSSLNLQPRSSPSDAGSGAPPPENHPAPLPFQNTIPWQPCDLPLGLPDPPDMAPHPLPPLPAHGVQVTQAPWAAPLLAAQARLKQTNTSQSFGRRGAFRPGSWLEKINAAKLSGSLGPCTLSSFPELLVALASCQSDELQYHKNH